MSNCMLARAKPCPLRSGSSMRTLREMTDRIGAYVIEMIPSEKTWLFAFEFYQVSIFYCKKVLSVFRVFCLHNQMSTGNHDKIRK